MGEIAPSRSILFGTSKGFAPVPHMELGDRFPSESSILLNEIKGLSGKTEPLRLTTMFSENGPKSSWSGLAIGVKSLASELRSNEVAYETADHKLGIAFSSHIEVVKPTGIGGARAQHLEMCGQRMARIIERGELAKLAEAYVASGKQINEQWLWDTFNTKSASGLRDILHEYSDALQTVMEETWKDLAFGKLPEKPMPSIDAQKGRITVSKGTMPIENVFQVVTAEHALSPVVNLTSMDKANIGVVFIIGAAANAGCTPIQAVTPTETIQIPSPKITPEIPTDVKPTVKPTEVKPATTATNPITVGPEATPGASIPYPTELSSVTIKNLIVEAEPVIPNDISSNEGVKAIIEKHTGWAQKAGLDFDTMKIHMAPDGEHWYLVPEKNGVVAGWLMIEDASSQSGWRYAEQPTYDSKFNPNQDTYKFGLPNLRNAGDHWDVVYAGFPVLTEVSANGEPQYWNNISAKEMQLVEGAPLVEPEFRVGPESMVEGQYNQLEWDKFSQQIDQLLPMFEKYMQENGITADKVASFDTKGGLFQTAAFPYATYGLTINSDTILGYSLLTMPDKTQMYVMHVPIRRSDSQDITILTIALEESSSFWQDIAKERYDLKYNPRTIFPKYTSDNAPQHVQLDVSLNISSPGGTEWVDDFPETKFLFENNIPDNYDNDVRKSGRLLNAYILTNGATEQTLETWATTLEHQVLPAIKIHVPDGE